MSNSQRLYHTVTRAILAHCPTARITQTRNLAWFIVGLVVAAHCQLTQIAPHLPWAGNRDSLVQRLRRVLMNQRLAVRTLYGPTVGYILRWLNSGQPLILVIDRTTIKAELNILLIGVAFRGRVLPLAWKVQRKQGTFQLRYVQAALRFIASWAPAAAAIWLVGDREFQDVALQTFVRDTLHWHFVQRIDQNLWIYPRGRRAFKLNTSGLRPGQFRSFGRVCITRQHFGWVELIGYWRPGEDEPWYLISDRTLGRQAIRIYRRRFAIEAMFRDFKSHGWNLEASGLRHPARFERLLLVIAFAYVWLVTIGVAVVKCGLRYRLDRRARRTLSYFRLGWDWLKRLLAQYQTLPKYVWELNFAK
jgi:hypothetical protein